jgi:uncharacterized membrane protein
MKTAIASYVISVLLFLGIDGLWLRTMVPSFYLREIGPLLREAPNLPVALGFYLLFVAGICVLAIWPALGGGGVSEAAWKGGVLGLVAYATYDLTNLSTMKGFTARVAMVDMVWGMVLSAAVAALTVIIIRQLRLA